MTTKAQRNVRYVVAIVIIVASLASLWVPLAGEQIMPIKYAAGGVALGCALAFWRTVKNLLTELVKAWTVYKGTKK